MRSISWLGVPVLSLLWSCGPASPSLGSEVLGSEALGIDDEEFDLPAPLESIDWAQQGRTARHTSHNPYEVEIGPANVAALRELWRLPVRFNAFAPTIWKGRLFSEQLWSDPDTGCDCSALESYDALTGAPLSRLEVLQESLATPAVGFGTIAIAGDNFNIFSIKQGASLRMGSPSVDFQQSPPVIREWTTTASPPQRERRIFVHGRDLGVARAFSTVFATAETGAGAYAPAFTLSVPGNAFGAPGVAMGRLYVGGGEGTMLAVDAASGSEIWRRTTVALGAFGGVSVLGGRAFVASSNRTEPGVGASQVRVPAIQAFETATGALLWSTPLTGVPALDPPAAALGYVFTVVAATVAVHHQTSGTLKLTINAGETLGPAVAIANGVLYVTTDSGRLLAFDAENGQQLAAFQLGTSRGLFAPAVVNGRVYVTTRDRLLIALGL